jgi:outer membrane protein OmpA-like peptidoglycan-associated protein
MTKIREIFIIIVLLVCFFEQLALAQYQDYKLEKLPSFINTPNFDEIAPVAAFDGNALYFTRVGHPDFNRTLVEDGKDLSVEMSEAEYLSYLAQIHTRLGGWGVSDPVRSGFNQDIWFAEGEDGNFTTLSHPGYPLNNALPNSISSLTPSANEVVVLNQFEAVAGGMKKGFSISRKDGDHWSFPEPVGIDNYHNSGTDVSMNMSHDGSVLLMAMERDDSYGQSDIYISFRIGTNSWSEPKNMGSRVNTAAKETTPFISEDQQRLFFSSNRNGNSDIYMLVREGEGWDKWSAPRRFKEPVNSPAHDSQPFFNSATGYMYFTSNRDGSGDIFRVRIAPPVPVGVTIRGKVINSETGELLPARIISNMVDNSTYSNIYIADDGTFTLVIPRGIRFSVVAEKPGYTNKGDTLFFRSDYFYFKEKELILSMNPMKPGSTIDLDPVFFSQSTPEILEMSYPALDKLAEHLRENYFVTILIKGHTDNQGEEHLLQKLSEERAQAVKDYLVYKRNVNPLRIETIGLGCTEPLTDNSTDELRSYNRRVEVEIIRVHEPELTSQGEDKGKK